MSTMPRNPFSTPDAPAAIGRGRIDLTLDTPGIAELQKASAAIRKITGVDSVERVVR